MFLSSYTITTTNDGSIHQTFNKDTSAWEKIKAQLVEVLSWHENYQNNKIFKGHKSTMMKVDLILSPNHGIQKPKTRT